MRSPVRLAVASLVGVSAVACPAVTCAAANSAQNTELSATDLFAFADAAKERGDFKSAEIAYRALTQDPDGNLRSEARFRLALILVDHLNRPREAALELRRILDDKPNATRVRLELARVNALLGDLRAARRELRAVQAGKLPADVQQLVRFFANALVAQKRAGGSFELAIAPDSNVNRATRSDTLGTVIGDFTLDDDARAQSGTGVAIRGQSYARIVMDANTTVLLRASGTGNLYRSSRFNDIATALQVGPEIKSGADRAALSVGPSWRWYGNRQYSFSMAVSGEFLHPLGARSQLRAEASIAHTDNRLNDLQDGDAFSALIGVDHAFSSRFGGGVQFSGVRTTARDPGYADASGAVSAYLFHEVGRTTIVGGASYSHLETDERLFLYPERRRDNRFSGNLGATFRSLTFHTFAPFARVTAERNHSTVGIYDFARIAVEFGLTSAF